jgi:hypothetical protein
MFKQRTRRYQLEKRIHFPDSLYFFIFLYIYIYSLSLFLSEVIQKGQTQVVVGSDTVPDTILEPQLWQLW